jgi:hypothetical protein
LRSGRQDRKGEELLLVLFFEVVFIFFHEFLNPAGGIDQFLLAGEEGMTGRADLDPDLFFHGADLHFVAAGTFGLDLMIFWMDVAFHLLFLLYFKKLPFPKMDGPRKKLLQLNAAKPIHELPAPIIR